jgi:ribosomal protein S12 methylthiotransferase
MPFPFHTLPEHPEWNTIEGSTLTNSISPSLVSAQPPHVSKNKKKIAKHTYALISLGCPKNWVDSERMAGLLQLDGYRMSQYPDGAELVVINTCGFIGDARRESHDTIKEMLELKKRGRVGRVIVTGCLAERDKESLLELYPDLDQIIGVFARDERS